MILLFGPPRQRGQNRSAVNAFRRLGEGDFRRRRQKIPRRPFEIADRPAGIVPGQRTIIGTRRSLEEVML